MNFAPGGALRRLECSSALAQKADVALAHLNAVAAEALSDFCYPRFADLIGRFADNRVVPKGMPAMAPTRTIAPEAHHIIARAQAWPFGHGR